MNIDISSGFFALGGFFITPNIYIASIVHLDNSIRMMDMCGPDVLLKAVVDSSMIRCKILCKLNINVIVYI